MGLQKVLAICGILTFVALCFFMVIHLPAKKGDAKMIVAVERLSPNTFKLYDRHVGWLFYELDFTDIDREELSMMEKAMSAMQSLSMWDSLNVDAKRECILNLIDSRPRRVRKGAK